MGPRSVDRGNSQAGRGSKQAQHASMGPRSVDRGNAEVFTEPDVGLQLQWGRDLLIAETFEITTTEEGVSPAPMGPRSVDRGNPGRPSSPSPADWLQWGRDLLIAETTWASRLSTPSSLLQW